MSLCVQVYGLRFCHPIADGGFPPPFGAQAGNVLYNPKTRDVRLIDWGFGQFYWKNKRTIKWPGTRSYKVRACLLGCLVILCCLNVWLFGSLRLACLLELINPC